MADRPPTPRGLGRSGRNLWRGTTEAFDLAPHELVLLERAARTADLCDKLQAQVDAGDVVDPDGTPSKALIELRQQSIVLGRLVVALRIPDGEGEEASRPQRRPGRGLYSVKGVS